MSKNISPKEIKARIRLEQVVERDLGAPVKRYRTWWLYFCPFHENHRTPALGVNLERGTFTCFSCEAHGDLFDWYMRRNGVDFRTALAVYREQIPDWQAQPRADAPSRRRTNWEQPPDDTWQLAALTFLQRSQFALWEAAGAPGRAELACRGIQEDTARRWGLGYNPRWRKTSGAAWGLPPQETVWLPQGLVIPGKVGVEVWYLKVRIFGRDGRPVGKASGKSKYMQIAGGHPALYGINHFAGHPRLLLAESELDAILAWQEGGAFCDVAALGGAGRRLSPRWMMELLPYPRIVVAYDRDAAGLQGARRLKELSQRMSVAAPPAEDLCAFYQQGGDLRGWLRNVVGKG